MNVNTGTLNPEPLDRSKYSETELFLYDSLEHMAGKFSGAVLVRDGDGPGLANEGIIFHDDTLSGETQAIIVQAALYANQAIPLSGQEAVALAKAILQRYGVSYKPRKG